MSQSQTKSLSGKKIAFLAANGFNEKTYTVLQRAVMKEGGILKLISCESGLVSGWNEENWGHHYAVDKGLEDALGTDYSMLIIADGAGSVDKLKLTAHTKRFIGSFMSASKPVGVCGDAVRLLAVIEAIAGYTVSGPDEVKESVLKAGGIWSDDHVVSDRNIVSGFCGNQEARENLVSSILSAFATPDIVEKVA